MIHDEAPAVCSTHSHVYESVLCMLIPAEERQSNPRLTAQASLSVHLFLPSHVWLLFFFKAKTLSYRLVAHFIIMHHTWED